MNEDLTPQTDPIAHPEAKNGGPRKIVLGLVFAIAGTAVIVKGYSTFSYAKTHVETENAYVTGDLVGISPTVSGNLAELTVQDGSFVKKGQLIARLDTAASQAALAQAEANLTAALSQVPQAESGLAFEQLSTQAAIQRSQAAISVQAAKTAGSRLQVKLSSDTVDSDVQRAQSQLDQAKAQADQAKAGIVTAQAGLTAARQAVVTARAAADAQTSMIAASSASAEKASQDLERYKKLLQTEAITRQEYDAATANSATAIANLASARQQAQAAASRVSEANAGVAQAQAGLVAARRQFDASQKQVEVARAGVQLAKSAKTNVGIQDSNVETNIGQQTQADADLATARAGLQQISLRKKQIATAKAQVEQARAAVAEAKVRVRDASLYAPCDGFVVRHTANVGTAINPGQTIVTITRGSDIWVMANYKETQLEHLRMPADIEIDAFPGKTFHGKVLNIIHATGSATTLLPPDNSTGNFTKVVQRVPVKICIEQTDAKKFPIRMGMSAVVTVDTGRGGE
jgi:membrane fusion protein (multidrug efflux system)